MSVSLCIPQGYRPTLDLQAVESAIKDIKDFFERNLAAALGLQRVTAPLFVRSGTGINDDLNGVEQPVRFRVKEDGDAPGRDRAVAGQVETAGAGAGTAFESARASTPT